MFVLHQSRGNIESDQYYKINPGFFCVHWTLYTVCTYSQSRSVRVSFLWYPVDDDTETMGLSKKKGIENIVNYGSKRWTIYGIFIEFNKFNFIAPASCLDPYTSRSCYLFYSTHICLYRSAFISLFPSPLWHLIQAYFSFHPIQFHWCSHVVQIHNSCFRSIKLSLRMHKVHGRKNCIRADNIPSIFDARLTSL